MHGVVAGDTGIPLLAQLDPKRFDSITSIARWSISSPAFRWRHRAKTLPEAPPAAEPKLAILTPANAPSLSALLRVSTDPRSGTSAQGIRIIRRVPLRLRGNPPGRSGRRR